MKKFDKFIKAGAAFLIVAAIVITSLLGDGTVLAAPSRMSGVQKVINTISETSPYTIVEIVPDKSDAAMGFLVKGQEPSLPAAVVNNLSGRAAREQAARQWLGTHAEGLITYTSSALYQEQLYRPERTAGWTSIYFQAGHMETRTGAYKPAVDVGLEYGSYAKVVDGDGNESFTYADNGEYVWVDGEGQAQEVEVRRVYCKVNYASANWFASKILEVEDEVNVEVKTFIPQDFEEMLRIGGISWNNVDLLVLGASDSTEYEAGKSDLEEWSSIVQIYNIAVGAKLPVILDDRIVQSEVSSNMQNLAYLLKAYNKDFIVGNEQNAEMLAQAKEEALKKTQAEGVCGNIFYGSKFVSTTLDDTLADFYGKEDVLSEFETENFYHEVNRAEYTSERQNDGTYAFTRASLVKYILHFGSKRAETSKESIRVLDIEPTKYSLLKEADVRSWLGDAGSDETLLDIEIVQTTTAEFNGLMTDLIEGFDLIYIGAYDGPAYDGQPFVGGLNTQSGNIVYNDKDLTNLIYSDLGDAVAVPGDDFAKTPDSEMIDGALATRYSGNDITAMKLSELKEYVDIGYPVIIADELYTGTIINANKVKSTSNMYAFMEGYTGEKSVGNVMKEGTTKPAMLSRYVNIAKLTMTMTNVPTAYELVYKDDAQTEIAGVKGLERDEETGVLRPLRYTFEFTDDARVLEEGMYYKVQLFVDNDADGQYSSYEELHELDVRDVTGNSIEVDQIKPGARYSVSRDLSSSYKGVLSWKLKVALFDADGNELSPRSSATGMTFVPYAAEEAGDADAIKVSALQLTVTEDGLSLTQGTVKTLLDDLRNADVYDIDIDTFSVNEYLALKDAENKKTTARFYEFLSDYDMLIIGFADNYAEVVVEGAMKETIDNALTAIEMYIEAGKAVLFSHDTASYKDIDPDVNYWGYALNRLVRKHAGMDRYGVLNETAEGQTDLKHKEGFSNMILDANSLSEYKSLAYSGSDATEPTSRISQVNVGQITSFPYDVNIDPADTSTQLSTMLGDLLWSLLQGRIPDVRIMTPVTQTIQPTNAQAYQLDLDCDRDGDGKSDLIVWYSLAGALGGDGLLSGIDALLESNAYAAMPNDVRNNYYIYSLGNVTYSAMGYSKELSNYEAKLLVNTLIAAYNLGLKSPTVNILDDKEDKGSVIYDVYRPFDEEAQIFCDTDQDIYFHVKDSNVISGSKIVTINVYKQVESNAADYDVETFGKNNEVIRLKLLREPVEPYKSMKYVHIQNEVGDAYQVDDHVYEVSIGKGEMNDVLTNSPSMKVYIGVKVAFTYDSGRMEETEETFATLEIKKMSLFNLD